MKKKSNILKNFYLGKGFFVIFFVLLVFWVCIRNLSLKDADLYFLINHGKYIFNHGFPYIEPFTIHENFNFVIQQWLSSLIFYLFYHFFGMNSILFLVVLANCLIVFIMYKLCMLVSDNNYRISSIFTIYCDLFLCYIFIVARPQIFTYILILLLIYSLELYIRKGKLRYLLFLPIISILQINLHASMWWMHYVFILPYLLDGYKFKFFKHEIYKKSPILIAMIIMFLVAFINPYGIDAITYLFKSYGVDAINNYVAEMKILDVTSNEGKVCFLAFIAVFGLYVMAGKDKVRIRYLLLLIGTFYLNLSSYKGFSYFLLIAAFPLACYFKDFMKPNLDRENYSLSYMARFSFISLVILVLSFIVSINGINYDSDISDGVDLLLDNYDVDNITLYVSYNYGSYTEFRGIKSYIDARAEVFLKSNNGVYDVFYEFINVESGKIDYVEFLDKYNFTHLLVDESSEFYDYLLVNEDYELFYKGKLDNGYKYRIYVRKDLFNEI